MNSYRRNLVFASALLVTILVAGFSLLTAAFGPMVAALLFASFLLVPQGLTARCQLGINAPGTIVGVKLIQKALRLCFSRFPSLTTFSMGFKELDGTVAQANLDQDVKSRILQVSPVTNFGTAPSDFNWSDVSGKLRNWRQVYHRFTNTEVQATDLDYITLSAEPMAIGLAQEITKSMFGMVSRTNFNTTVNSIAPYLSVASGWTYANTIVPLIGMCNDRGIPDLGQRGLIVNSSVNGAFLTDANLIAALNNPANAEAIKNGKLPRMQGGFLYDLYPSMAAAESNLIGICGTPDALLYIARAPKTPDQVFSEAAARAPFAWGIVTDPISGFSVLVQQWMEVDMSINTRLTWLDGYSVGNVANLIRLINGVVAGTSGVPVAAAKVTNPGYGYKNSSGVVTAPDVTVVPVGAGSGATAVATVDTVGAVTGITVSGGTGYTTGYTLTIAPVAGGRAAAPATATGATSGLN